MAGKFLYFAYGSNLLAKRIHKNNPSATRKAVACLKNYELGFGGLNSRMWGGCCATIRTKPSSCVWGYIWELSSEDLPHLEQQEIRYNKLYVTVETINGERMDCITFVVKEDKPGLPSQLYHQVITDGAAESCLPLDYQQYIKNIPTHPVECNGPGPGI